MANDYLFKQLCRAEIMKIGWHLAQADSRDDFVLDPVGNADFAADLTSRLQFLIEQVENHRYRARHLLEVDIPKSGLAVRPGNVLPIEEASLLHAIVYVLAPILDRTLSAGVFSYRLHKDWKIKARKGESMFQEGRVEFPFLKRTTINEFSPFEAWYSQWPEFEAATKRAVTVEGYTHLTKTDISAYFENIDLGLLIDQIRGLLKRREEKILQLLFCIFQGWRRTTSAGVPLDRGIPQGNDISSFLGNLYLIPLDDALTKFCRRCGGKWFRYVDDVKIFTRRGADAREAVFVVNEAIRALHLNLQGSKTKILSGVDLVKELDTSTMDRVNGAITKIRKANGGGANNRLQVSHALRVLSPLCSMFTRNLPESVRGLSGDQSRLFRRLLTAYTMAGRSRKFLPDAASAAIRELPDLRVLRSCLRYLTALPYDRHQESVEVLFGMLNAEELPFPYQAGAVLEAMACLHPSDVKHTTASKIRRYALGDDLRRRRNWLVTAKGLEALASFPYQEKYFDSITNVFVANEHPVVRRAAVACVPRCKKDVVRKKLACLAHHPDAAVSRMSLWLQRMHSDVSFVQSEFGRFKKGSSSDRGIIMRLPALYAACATDQKQIADQVARILDLLPETKSPKLAWHLAEMRRRIAWSRTGPVSGS